MSILTRIAKSETPRKVEKFFFIHCILRLYLRRVRTYFRLVASLAGNYNQYREIKLNTKKGGKQMNRVSKEELNEFDCFYVETRLREQYKIEKIETGFRLCRVAPSSFTVPITDYGSRKANGKHLSQSGESLIDGIVKGAFFAFRSSSDSRSGWTESKGKIERCFVKQRIGKLEMIVHLLRVPGRKVPLADYMGDDFTIHTKNGSYPFKIKGEECFFEGLKVHSILTILRPMKLEMDPLELILGEKKLERALEVVMPTHLYYNRPFLVIAEKADGKADFRFVFEEIKEIRVNQPEKAFI
jgi:hypothetical protein